MRSKLEPSWIGLEMDWGLNPVSELAGPDTDVGSADVVGGWTLKVNGFEVVEDPAPNPANPANFGGPRVSWTDTVMN